jgi:hypothetical protein
MGSFRLDPTRPAVMVWPAAIPACAAMEDIGLRRIELDGRVDR